RAAIQDRPLAPLVVETDLVEHEPLARIEAIAELPVAPRHHVASDGEIRAAAYARQLARALRGAADLAIEDVMRHGDRGHAGLVLEPPDLPGIDVDDRHDAVDERAELVRRMLVGREERAHQARGALIDA